MLTRDSHFFRIQIPFVFLGEPTALPPPPPCLPDLPSPDLLFRPGKGLGPGWDVHSSVAKWSGMSWKVARRTIALDVSHSASLWSLMSITSRVNDMGTDRIVDDTWPTASPSRIWHASCAISGPLHADPTTIRPDHPASKDRSDTMANTDDPIRQYRFHLCIRTFF